MHATTLVTNTVIERKGAKTGLVMTAGFRDIVEMGTEPRYDIYDLGIDLPPPLVPRELRREALERIDARRRGWSHYRSRRSCAAQVRAISPIARDGHRRVFPATPM
jgi:N-methylhydantoinase A/oxoprolinase/acetone carboxylase beta subunit